MRASTVVLLLLVLGGGVGFYLFWNSEAQRSARRSRRMEQSLLRDPGVDWIDPEGQIVRVGLSSGAFRVEFAKESGEATEIETELRSYRESNGKPGWQQGDFLLQEMTTSGGDYLSWSAGYESTHGEISIRVMRTSSEKGETVVTAHPAIRLDQPPNAVWSPLLWNQSGLRLCWRLLGSRLEIRGEPPELGRGVRVALPDGSSVAAARVGKEWIAGVATSKFSMEVTRLRTTVRVTRLAAKSKEDKPRPVYRVELEAPR